MNLRLVRPPTDAPDCLALYERLRAMGDVEDQDMINEVLEGLFSIVAKLESQGSSEAD